MLSGSYWSLTAVEAECVRRFVMLFQHPRFPSWWFIGPWCAPISKKGAVAKSEKLNDIGNMCIYSNTRDKVPPPWKSASLSLTTTCSPSKSNNKFAGWFLETMGANCSKRRSLQTAVSSDLKNAQLLWNIRICRHCLAVVCIPWLIMCLSLLINCLN